MVTINSTLNNFFDITTMWRRMTKTKITIAKLDTGTDEIIKKEHRSCENLEKSTSQLFSQLMEIYSRHTAHMTCFQKRRKHPAEWTLIIFVHHVT